MDRAVAGLQKIDVAGDEARFVAESRTCGVNRLLRNDCYVVHLFECGDVVFDQPDWHFLAVQHLPYSGPLKWVAVRQRFEQFHGNLFLTPRQYLDGTTKRDGVVGCLNRYYYGAASDTEHSFLIGSWGKDTAVRPPRDVDLYFLIPPAVHSRFQGYVWNRQSALLQEVKAILAGTYPDTDMSGDGQVVLVRFESYSVEVVPAFLLTNGRYWICNTKDGGSYKETNPWAEIGYIEAVDQANNRNLRPLIRMLKAWQAWCSVPVKSFQLELLAADFVGKSPWRLYDFFWFDWITRDFFAYLYYRANSFVAVPGTLETIYLGNDWQSRAESAYYRAVKACDYEERNQVDAAGEEWQKIFGPQIPRTV
jgi:Second Messenger Oligonucleotide or Dinucleotide Synthetase domain